MKLSEFLSLDNPTEYNFEFENKAIKEDKGLDAYSRYITYKANSGNARKSVYVNGKKFARDTFKKYGYIGDCDGTLENNKNNTCMFARGIYRNLWGWKDCDDKGEIQRYGTVKYEKTFGKMGPDTMNSAQTTMNYIIKEAFCQNEEIKALRIGKNFSNNFMIELFANEYSKEILRKWLDNVKGLADFLNLYHTIGNFVLVPAYFNPYRARKTDGYWDRSLSLMKNKNGVWASGKKEIQWDKDLYIRYINYFFLWDYTNCTEKYEPVIISDISNTKDIEHFLEITNRKICLRGEFMVAMLKIHEINPQYYTQLVDDIFNTDNRYMNYQQVIDAIKKTPCYEDDKVKRVIKVLEETVVNS